MCLAQGDAGPAFVLSSPSSLHPAQLLQGVSAHPSALLSSCYSCQSGITIWWVLHPTPTLQKSPAATLLYAGGCRNSIMTARSNKNEFKLKGFMLSPHIGSEESRMGLSLDY